MPDPNLQYFPVTLPLLLLLVVLFFLIVGTLAVQFALCRAAGEARPEETI